jgi:hypothetical protein
MHSFEFFVNIFTNQKNAYPLIIQANGRET